MGMPIQQFTKRSPCFMRGQRSSRGWSACRGRTRLASSCNTPRPKQRVRSSPAAGLSKNQEIDFFFAGIARSKSVRSPSDGQGETVDEFFTLSIGGMVTLLNNSGAVISPGDQVEWCFTPGPGKGSARPSGDPRRVGVKVCSPNSPRAIGRALSFSKNGETFDLLLSGN